MKIQNTYSNLLFLLISLLLISCGNDDEGTTAEPEATPPILTSLSTNFIIEGESLTLEGSHFVDPNFQTMVLINGIPYEVEPESDGEIILEIDNTMGTEQTRIEVKVSDKRSEALNLFIVPKGWYKINIGNASYIKAFVFDNSNDIMALIGTNNPKIMKLTTNENGYTINSPTLNINTIDLEMYDINTGVGSNALESYYTKDGFQTYTKFGDLYNAGAQIRLDVYDRLLLLDEGKCITTNTLGAHFATNDFGQTETYSETPSYLKNPSFTIVSMARCMGKGSDNIFYEIGLMGGSQDYLKFTQKSSDGLNWDPVDTLSTWDFNFSSFKFYDYDLIFSKTSSNELAKSTDLSQTWQIVRGNIDQFFIENENRWYVISDSDLWLSEDAGSTWNLELDLPSNAVVKHMYFTENKILLCGENNLIYIKHRE